MSEDNRDDPQAGPDQLALPLAVQPVEADPAAVSSWPGWRAARAAERWRRLPLRVTARVGLATLRWGLRLALPILGMAVMLRSFPYRTTVQGVPLQVQGTILHNPGLSADTTFGNWEFPAVDGLPFGVHISPQNVDVLQLVREANPDTSAFVAGLRTSVADQLPQAVLWLVTETLLGLALGLAAAAGINMALGYLSGRPRRPDELAHRLRQAGAAATVVVLLGCYGVWSYNPRWSSQSKLTGTLAAAQLFPDQLSNYYQRGSKTYDVLGSVVGLQAALQADLEQTSAPPTAFRIMFVSDLHLEAVYPLLAQYAKNYNVKLIINTGDESEFATKAELSPAYIASITALTKTVPMLWLAGNHDSPAVQSVMAAIPGVTVLGSKTNTDSGFAVAAKELHAYGLTIAGVPDPRVYGGPGAYGADDDAITDPLERQAVDGALAGVGQDGPPIDIFATHEPVAAAEIRKLLAGRVRQTNVGHLHAQNRASEIQQDGTITLVEGSTGAGGLDNIVRGAARPPIEFSIESVAADCQFTRVLRFQIKSPQPATTASSAYGDNVTVSTVYFTPQPVDDQRSCDVSSGIGTAGPITS